ncbi:endothelin-converting enzyme 2-like [Amblyomma americanum]
MLLPESGGCSSEVLGYSQWPRDALPPSPAAQPGSPSPFPAPDALVESAGSSKLSPGFSAARSTQGTTRAPPDTIESFFFAATCAVLLLLALALATMYIVNVIHLQSASQLVAVKHKACPSQECQRHARLLIGGLNRSLDPCHDFGAYVCSAWKPRSRSTEGYSNDFNSQLNDVVTSWLKGLEDLLIAGVDEVKVAVKPLALLRSCRVRRRATGVDLEDFREFMSLLGLCWPHDTCCDVSALGVLLGLVYRWDLCFWLRLRVLRDSELNGSGRRLTVYPGPRAFVERFAARHTYVVLKGNYVAYWTGHLDALLQDVSMSSRPPAVREDIERFVKAEHVIATALYNTVAKGTWEPIEVPLSDIGNYTGNVSSKDWLDKINANVVDESAMPFTEDERVLVTDVSVLEAVEKIFGTFKDREIVAHLSWQFVQEFSAVVDPTLEGLYKDNGDKLFCAGQVELVYAPVTEMLHWRLQVTRGERRYIDGKLERLVQRATEMMQSLWWLDSKEKRAATEKLRTLRVRMRPSEQVELELERMYHDFPNGTDSEESFVKSWLKTRGAFSRLASQRVRDGVARFGPTLSPLMIAYDYADNAVNVAAASLTSPLYYLNATPAMFYGGIGFYFTAEAMRALDWTGLQIGANGHIVSPSWMSNATRQVMESRLSCPTAGVPNEALLPYLPALEVVRKAFFEDTETSDYRLEVTDDLNEVKAFFMTLCRVVCANPPWGRAAADCNAILKNSRDFAVAYRCQKDSPMNPSMKCGYFS